MKKRLLSLFLAWAMCLTMLPAMALADEEPESEPVAQSEDDAEPVMDEAAFRAAVAAGGEVKLTGNVTLTPEGAEKSVSPYVTVQNNVQLDLNGYTITANFSSAVFWVQTADRSSTDYPTLTLDDTRGGGKITHGTYFDEESGTEKTYTGAGVYVPRGHLIMNGGTITGNIGTTAATGMAGGVVISCRSMSSVQADSTFTMTGGAITGNIGKQAGGISILTDHNSYRCQFTMTGGTISGNQATGDSDVSVGGVYLNSSAFTMTGGSITGNNSTVTDTSNYSTTGGVLVISSVRQSVVTVGGTAQVCDNWISGEQSGDSYVKGDDGVAGNVWLGTYSREDSNTTISISTDTPLTSDAKIGVTTNIEPTSDATAPFATGAKAADKAYFSSDKGNGIVFNSDSDQLEMQAVAHSHDDGEGFMHTLTSNDSSQLVIDDEVQEATQGPSQYAPDYYYLPSGNYYLAGDLKLDHTLFINDHAEVSICLNGHNIIANVPERETVYSFDTIYVTNYSALTVTDCHDIDHAGKITHIRDTAYHSGGGVDVSSHSTFTLHNGIISGNNAINIQKDGRGGGVSVSGTSTFNMTGGSITGNTANGGGGVNLHESAFNMTGGSITGNKAVGGVYYGSTYKISYYGGGVLLEEPSQYIENSTMTVSGSVKITGNKNDTEIENNVLGGPITIGNSGLNSDAEIGISLFSTLGTNDYEIIAANVPNEAYKDYLTQDTTEYTFVYHDKTLMLVNGKVHIHTICGVADCTEHGGELLFENKLTASNSTLYINGKTVTSTSGSNYYSLPSGHYYLDSDITLNKLLSVDGDVTICLNGHKIISNYAQTLNIEEYWGQGRTLTLTDCQNSGEITSTETIHSSGVRIDTNCTFNMYGGTITGNSTGVSVSSSGFFNMYGGSITGNSFTSGRGVGVEVRGTSRQTKGHRFSSVDGHSRRGTPSPSSGRCRG